MAAVTDSNIHKSDSQPPSPIYKGLKLKVPIESGEKAEKRGGMLPSHIKVLENAHVTGSDNNVQNSPRYSTCPAFGALMT